MKLRIGKKFIFDAAHHLPDYVGKCANLHGHRWGLEVVVEGDVDEKTGMVTDFKNIKQFVEEKVIGLLDHSYLNDRLYNPTAEEIVPWITDRLEQGFYNMALALVSVRLYETPDNWVEWRK